MTKQTKHFPSGPCQFPPAFKPLHYLSFILILICLLFPLSKTSAQTNDPHLEYLEEFHKDEAEYLNQLYLENPDIIKEELRNKMREYYRENFNPPMPNFDREPSLQKTSDNANMSVYIAPTGFNQVSDSIEYQALKALFDSTNGPGWTNYTNWDYPNWKDHSTVTSSDFSDWYGITVLNGDVSRIHLYNNQLSGPIPPELGNLSSLEILYLINNQLSGSIPPEVGGLSTLTSLYLYNNQLSGPIPPQLGSLSSLRNLRLNDNQLSGQIPPELASLSSMQILALYDNQLSGPIPPELGNLSSLEILYLQGNQLSGSLPPELGNLSSLHTLYLMDNQISGPIPPEIGNLTSLCFLFLFINQLSGPLPPELGNLSSLKELNFFANQLSGPIPPELEGMSSIEWFSLGNNQITGPIPAQLSNLSTLKWLYLYDNQISGSLPTELSFPLSLEDLYLNNNQLSGSIPSNLAELTSLSTLHLGNNQLSGSIPSEFDNLDSLKYLDLSLNEIDSIPPAIGDLLSLRSLYLFDNQISGSLQFVDNLLQLDNLRIQDNIFTYNYLEYLFNDQGNKYDLQNFYYSPQKTILGDSLSLSFALNQTIAIPFSPGGSHNLYQWQKLNGSNWEDIAGATSANFEKQNAVLSDAGTYRCKVTNGWVTGLTLYSHEITVAVKGPPDPPIVSPAHICPGQSATLTATGSSTIRWFDMETGGDTLATGSSFTTPVLTETTTYYVSQEVNGAQSERAPVTAFVGPVFTVTPDTAICNGNDITLSIEGDSLTVDWGQYGIGRNIVVEPDTTTVYPYTIEDAYGCTASGQITVAVLDSLIAEIVPPTPVCPGAPAVLEAVEVPGATYSWEPGGLTGRTITVQHDELQEYTLTVSNAAGCTSTATAFVRFAAMAVASEDQTICVTDSVVLGAEGGDSYLWSTGDTTAQVTFNPETGGEYTFTVNVTSDNCTVSEDVVVIVEPYCPGAPISFLARGISTTEIALEWLEPAGNQQQYVVQRRNAQGTYETVDTVFIGTSTWQDSNLEPDSLYYYRIYAQVASVQSSDRHGSARTFRPDENYVHEITVLVEGIGDPTLVPGLGNNERLSSWTYLNGLGAEMQMIGEGASPTGKDVVQPIVYDEYGMVSKQYLPYTVAQDDPEFRDEAEQEVLDFYSNPPAAVETSPYPFASTLYDKSPHNKILKQGAPGQAWQIDTGYPVEIISATNNGSEVLEWQYNTVIKELTANGFYPAAQLAKSVSINEDGEEVATFTDMLGRVLKQAVYFANGEVIETYFVYNNKGQLLCKVSPLAVDHAISQGSTSYVIDPSTVESLCHTYTYDELGRLIIEDQPDREPIFYVYDQWGRLVLSQDGKQRQRNEWSFTKYDRYDRAIMSGLFDTTAVLSPYEAKAAVDVHYAKPSSRRFETYGGNIHDYTTLSYPVLTDGDACLAVTYFDSYDFIDEVNGFGAGYAFEGALLDAVTVVQGTYYYPSNGSLSILGKPTGSKTKVLGRDQWLSSVTYYDQWGRIVQSVSENYAGNIDRAGSLYNFAGWPLSTYLGHTGPDGRPRGIKRRYVYDHTGRLLEGYHEIFDNDVGQGEVFLAENKYNELGELVEKNLHVRQGKAIQSIDYRYNIRGWLKSINGTALDMGQGINAGDANPDLFGMDLIYEGVLNGIQNND